MSQIRGCKEIKGVNYIIPKFLIWDGLLMLQDKDGNRLFRKVIVKIIFPDEIFPPKIITQRAGPHQGFGPSGIDDILMKIADNLDEKFPWWDFKVVALAPEGRTAKYVLTFAGYRSTKINPNAESNTLEPGTTKSITPTEAKSEVGNSLVVPLSQE